MSARADLTDSLIDDWHVVRKAPAQNRVPHWTVKHACGAAAIDVPHTVCVSASKGKGQTPPCTACTPAEAGPAISHGMHLACGQAHLVGTPCGKAGPGECQHGVHWQSCADCSARAIIGRGGVIEVPRAQALYVEGGIDGSLDLDGFAAWDDEAPRELDLDALDAEPLPPVLHLDLAGFAAEADEHDETCCMAGISAAAGYTVVPHSDCPGMAAIKAARYDALLGPVAVPRSLDLDGPKPEILRNGRGQPMIVPREGGKAVPYSRASSFAKTLDDAGGLTTWKVRLAGLGVAKNPDLAMMAAALEYGDRELDAILETAHDRAGGNEKANWGTAVHSFADRPEVPVPVEMVADVAAYRHALAVRGIEIAELGRFIVNDTYKVAGTFDQILKLPDGRRVMADLKTGTLHPLACAIQLACYAGGDLYALDEHGNPVRTPLLVDQDVAIIAHIPKGTGTCELYEVDLHLARARANLAVAVRAARKDKAKRMPLPVERVSA